MGYKAALNAIEMANWDIKTIDLIVLATSTPNDLFGSAPSIQSKLGAYNAVAFDLTAACSGFLFALITASQFLKGGSTKGLLLSEQINYPALLIGMIEEVVSFGDGAGALAIEATNEFDNFIDLIWEQMGKGFFSNLPSKK